MTEIFVEVRGGVLVESYSNKANVIVRIIDWDNINAGDESVARIIPCLPLDQMPAETLATSGVKLHNS